MLKQPENKYHAFAPVDLPDRQWPSRTITRAPIWLSTDLRDGNQALFEPMNSERKLRFFKMLCEIGVKEIEVAFPSASQTDYDFVRTLIDDGLVPRDVTITALTQAREHLIQRTVESLRGAHSAVVHVYNATSRRFRDVVFGMSRDEVRQLAVDSVKLIRELTDAEPLTRWQLEYSPETFTATELDFTLEVCDAVVEAWGASPDRKVIINLPATVEVATPNIYADQMEWMHRHLARRDCIILSAHPHNDRGCAVAAAELAQMAGVERVEGCLFGNGERTGNVDLVTLALNLYTQGIDPGLDFSHINEIARVVEHCNQLPIHPRHPYVGDLVFTAFSGSHQDAIKKGMAAQKADDIWEVPYLPIDPADLGRSYDSIIRINSQSGKGGVAYLLENDHGLVMPRRLQVEFSGVVQRYADAQGSEIGSEQLWKLFAAEYLNVYEPLRCMEHHLYEHGSRQGIRLVVDDGDDRVTVSGEGNGPLDAAVNALGRSLSIQSYEERSLGQGAGAKAVAFVELRLGEAPICYGVGVHANIVTASLNAIFSALDRSLVKLPPGQQTQYLQALRAVSSDAA